MSSSRRTRAFRKSGQSNSSLCNVASTTAATGIAFPFASGERRLRSSSSQQKVLPEARRRGAAQSHPSAGKRNQHMHIVHPFPSNTRIPLALSTNLSGYSRKPSRARTSWWTASTTTSSGSSSSGRLWASFWSREENSKRMTSRRQHWNCLRHDHPIEHKHAIIKDKCSYILAFYVFCHTRLLVQKHASKQ